MKRSFGLFGMLAFTLCLGTVPTFARPVQGQGGGTPGGNISRRASHTGSGKTSTTAGGQKNPDELLTQNSKLANMLQDILPKGIGVHAFCDGFKNLGPCVAAIHVAHNLGFTPQQMQQFHRKMVAGMSLGNAIHQIKPAANATAEANKGNKQASHDLKETRS